MIRPNLRWDQIRSRRTIRLLLATVVLLAAMPVVMNFATAIVDGEGGHQPAPPRDAATVVTDQTGHLVVYGADGSVVFDDHRYHRYWDVDPVADRERTLLYTATTGAPASACGEADCDRNVVGLLNVTTGERTHLFSRAVRTGGSNEWHDADRVNETHVAVADIREDRVFIADVETGQITWAWNASEHFAPSSGGPPDDWTHLNDVEVLPDGRLMVSIRNQDQIVFVEPGTGVQGDWTLGSEDDHGILFGQHNPDYIPESRGGPAVLVADSHNNRVVEYQRRDGQWNQAWQWADSRMQWTRDADRLPNGNTLVTDTNGNRVLEIDRRGGIVWSVPFTKAYEAERLGTGDESASGESAEALGLAAQTNAEGRPFLTRTIDRVTDAFPAFAFNSLMYITPVWMGQGSVLLLLVTLVTVLVWGLAELHWRGGARGVLGLLQNRTFER